MDWMLSPSWFSLSKEYKIVSLENCNRGSAANTGKDAHSNKKAKRAIACVRLMSVVKWILLFD
jgi:hypothetical protein